MALKHAGISLPILHYLSYFQLSYMSFLWWIQGARQAFSHGGGLVAIQNKSGEPYKTVCCSFSKSLVQDINNNTINLVRVFLWRSVIKSYILPSLLKDQLGF